MLLMLVTFAIIIIIDFLPLVHKKDKKAVILFIIIFIFAFAYNLLLVLNVDIKSTLMLVVELFKSLGITYPPPS